MLNSLRFVQGAVAKRDHRPILSHFKIQNGFVRGYNGVISLCSPIPVNIDANPQAVSLVKALRMCEDTVAVSKTTAGRLMVKSGTFKAFVDCQQQDFPEVNPEGDVVPLPSGFIPALKKLSALTATDSSHLWAQGVLFRGQSAYATNNAVLAEYWLGSVFPVEINVPRIAINELLRIGQDPISVQVAQSACTFHYPENRWLRTITYTTQWPPLNRVLDVLKEAPPVPASFWSALEKVLPFVDNTGVVFLTTGTIRTHAAEGAGASATIEGLTVPGTLCFRGEHLALIRDLATRIDFSAFPAPCAFFGDRVRGVIIGMHYAQ